MILVEGPVGRRDWNRLGCVFDPVKGPTPLLEVVSIYCFFEDQNRDTESGGDLLFHSPLLVESSENWSGRLPSDPKGYVCLFFGRVT